MKCLPNLELGTLSSAFRLAPLWLTVAIFSSILLFLFQAFTESIFGQKAQAIQQVFEKETYPITFLSDYILFPRQHPNKPPLLVCLSECVLVSRSSLWFNSNFLYLLFSCRYFNDEEIVEGEHFKLSHKEAEHLYRYNHYHNLILTIFFKKALQTI